MVKNDNQRLQRLQGPDYLYAPQMGVKHYKTLTKFVPSIWYQLAFSFYI